MRSVSEEWRAAQRDILVPESFLEISMKVGDPTIKTQAKIEDNGHEIISSADDVLSGTADPIKYATLEPFIWLLDGSCELIGQEGDDEAEGFIPKDQIQALLTRENQEFNVIL